MNSLSSPSVVVLSILATLFPAKLGLGIDITTQTIWPPELVQARLPRADVKQSSWPNQIEVVFGIIRRRVMRHGSFTSQADLREKLTTFINYFDPPFAKPFNWTCPGKPTKSKAHKRPRTCREKTQINKFEQILALVASKIPFAALVAEIAGGGVRISEITGTDICRARCSAHAAARHFGERSCSCAKEVKAGCAALR